MKPDTDKIKAGLRHCMEPDLCDGCLYMERPSGQQECRMHQETLALIDWYEAQLKAKDAQIAARDAQIMARDAILDEAQRLVNELKEATGA